MNLNFRSRTLQVLFWWRPSDIPEHWALRAWRWPSGETLANVQAAGLTNFGFRALTLGPLEFRYWRNNPRHKD